MRNYLSLTLLAVILMLLGGYWIQVRSVIKPMAALAENSPQAGPLLKFDPDEVVNFQIQRGRNPVISVKRQGDKEWSLESPFHARADGYLVERVLTVLRLLTVKQTVRQEEIDLAQFGLDHEDSLIKVIVETNHTRHWTELGDVSSSGAIRYARSGDIQGIALIEQKSIHTLPHGPGELLDRRIFPLAQETLHTIEIKDTTRSVILQAGDKEWMIESPLQARTDYQVMTEWLQRLAGLSASAVHPSDSQTGSQLPGSWIGSLRIAAGEVSATANVFRTRDRIIIHRSDEPSLQFEILPEMISTIFPDLFTLRDKHILQAEPSAFAFVEFRQYGHSVGLIRTKTSWTYNGQLIPPDQAEVMEHWLMELSLSEGSSLIPLPRQCGIAVPWQWELRLRDQKSHLLGRLQLARTQSCGDVATLPSGEWVRLQTTSLIDRLSLHGG